MNSITDIKNAPYPRMIVDLKKLRHNLDVVIGDCRKSGIGV